jgi:hypothetical protein
MCRDALQTYRDALQTHRDALQGYYIGLFNSMQVILGGLLLFFHFFRYAEGRDNWHEVWRVIRAGR